MAVEEIVSLADIKEKQALAYTQFYMDKVSNDDLQKGIDNYCESIAKSFIQEHSILEDEQLMLGLRQYIISIDANKKHSGHRFYEMLYIQLDNLQKEKVVKSV